MLDKSCSKITATK